MNNIAQDSSMQLSFRQAIESDLPRILELNNHLHEAEPILTADERIRSIWQTILKDDRLHCHLAVVDGVVVGFCILDVIPNLTRGARPFAVLQNVVTDREYRGRGIGSQLNAYVLEFAWSQNCYQVLVQTGRPEVTSFYERLGFRRQKIGLVAKPEWCKR